MGVSDSVTRSRDIRCDYEQFGGFCLDSNLRTLLVMSMLSWSGKMLSCHLRVESHRITSNSTWIGEDRPCITYGLRGVVHCALEVRNSLV